MSENVRVRNNYKKTEQQSCHFNKEKKVIHETMFVLNYYWITIAKEKGLSALSLLILWAVLSFVSNINIWSIWEVAERVIYKVAKNTLCTEVTWTELLHENFENAFFWEYLKFLPLGNSYGSKTNSKFFLKLSQKVRPLEAFKILA